MAAPRRSHTSTRLVGFLAVFACSKSTTKPIRQDAAPPPVAADAAAVAEPTDAAESSGKITISVARPKAPGSGLAKRCALGGPPLEAKCIGDSSGLAIDKAGTIYLTSGKQLVRFKRTDGEPCKLEPDGTQLDLPPDNPRPQKLGGGPVYMRSGGVAWSLVQTPDAIYALDFLAGMFRVDRGKTEPACTELFGFRTVAKHGKRWLGLRKGIEELAIGKAGKCTAKSAKIDDKARELFVVGDQVFTKFDDLGVRICSKTAMTACGDGACLVDHNCKQIIQLAGDGSVLRTIDGDKLFDASPWAIDSAVTASDGTVFLRAVHRDKVDAKETCETAVYAVPAAVFAR